MKGQVALFDNIPMDNSDAAKKKEKFQNITHEIILELIEERKINLKIVSEEAEVPYSTVYFWANNLAKPTIDHNLKKLSIYFGVSLDYLCFGIGPGGEEEEVENG